MENQETIEEIPTKNLLPLEIMVNIKGDCTIGGFIVVEKDKDEYNDSSFISFVSSPETLKGVLFSNWLDIILDNMIQPLVYQSYDIVDKYIENLVTISRIKEPIKLNPEQ